jgi:ABC-type dipeptide/oligopeptide/nickel transport system permease subunit
VFVARWQAPARLVLVLLVLAALGAPWLAPADPNRQLDIVRLVNAAPSAAHLLGTDMYSRDVLSRALYGARTSLVVGGVAAILALSVAVLWVLVLAQVPRIVRTPLTLLSDTLRALPRKLVLLAALLLVSRPGLWQLAVLLGLTSWTTLTPVLHAELARAEAEPFVEASRALGASAWQITRSHLLPALRAPLAAMAALVMADFIALEAALAFLGIGVRPPIASWGGMLQDALPYLRTAWWVALVPIALVATTVLCVSVLGDRAAVTGDPV